MKAIVFNQFGIENLTLAEIPQPIPQPNEVLVRIKAASLQNLDLMTVKGIFIPDLPLPHTPVCEGAGIVENVGSQVTQWKKGDRILIPFIQKWQAGKITAETNGVRTGIQTAGTLSEYIVLPENTLVRSPKNLTDIEAAPLSVAGLTAWASLVTNAKIRAGQTILIQGSGGVSLFALQIAKLFGVKIIATTSDDEKGEKLKALGADEVINYKKHPEWSSEVKRLNGGQGIDITLDVAGQDTIAQSILSCKENGYIGLVGFLTGSTISINLSTVIMKYIRLQGNLVGSAQELGELVQAIEINNLKPIIDTVYPIEKTQEAFTHLESGKTFGKIIITP
jgi:NADPH:quinone reductase-like Zn-dependent oxidoreductase